MRELYCNLDLDMEPLVDMTMPTKTRHNLIVDDNINPLFRTLLTKLGVYTTQTAIFYSKPGFYTRDAHIDCDNFDSTLDWPSIARINYVLGEKNTLTMWYDILPNMRNLAKSDMQLSGRGYKSFPLLICKKIKECSLNGWFLSEGGIPHTVSTPTPNPKWTISFPIRDIRSSRWLSMPECMDIFKDYI